jgi:hypothetical protein
MAKPMPTLPPLRETMAVLMPASLPSVVTRAPPELPGLMAASVWMKNCLGARQRRDDTHGHRLAHAEGITDCQHQIAHLHRIGVGKGNHRQVLAMGVDLEHGQIGARIGQKHLGLELALV